MNIKLRAKDYQMFKKLLEKLFAKLDKKLHKKTYSDIQDENINYEIELSNVNELIEDYEEEIREFRNR